MLAIVGCGARTDVYAAHDGAAPVDSGVDAFDLALGDDAASPCAACAWRCDPTGRCDDAVQVVVGAVSTCALSASGIVDCWGTGAFAAGEAPRTLHAEPTRIDGVGPTLELAHGGHVCARLAPSAEGGGRVFCWGTNSYGELGDGTHTDRVTPVAVVGVDDAIDISASYGGTCAVRSNGRVACWGYNPHARLGDRTTIDRPVAEDVHGVEDAVEVTLGGVSACALRADGSVVCWGGNFSGELGNGTMISNPEPTIGPGASDAHRVSGGPSAVCVLNGSMSPDATLTCWGELRDPTPALDPPANLLSPTRFTTFRAVRQISMNENSVCVRGDLPGEPVGMYCWGYNASGQLGNGTTTSAWTPIRVLGLEGGRDLALGAETACAVDDAGAVYCWGRNERGTLGNGATLDALQPMGVNRPR